MPYVHHPCRPANPENIVRFVRIVRTQKPPQQTARKPPNRAPYRTHFLTQERTKGERTEPSVASKQHPPVKNLALEPFTAHRCQFHAARHTRKDAMTHTAIVPTDISKTLSSSQRRKLARHQASVSAWWGNLPEAERNLPRPLHTLTAAIGIHETSLGPVLRVMGWTRVQVRLSGPPCVVWCPPGTPPPTRPGPGRPSKAESARPPTQATTLDK